MRRTWRRLRDGTGHGVRSPGGGRIRLRSQVLLLQCAVVVVTVATAFGAFAYVTEHRVIRSYQQRALAVARTVASQHAVRSGAAHWSHARSRRPDGGAAHAPRSVLAHGEVQQLAETVRARTGSLFVVVTDDRGIRLAHPQTAQLGRMVSTDPTRALSGHVELAYHRAHLGEEVVAKVPVYAPGSSSDVVGEANVGVAASEVRTQFTHVLLVGLGWVCVALALGVGASALLARRWKRLTLGLEPEELAGLVQEQEAVLHGIGDGVLAVGSDGTVTVANEEVRRLLGTPAVPGSRLADAGLTPRVRKVVHEQDGRPVETVVGDRVLVLSARPVDRAGRDLGTLLTVRDRTDVESLTRQLDAVQAMSASLRAQRHEFANRLHVLSGLAHGGHTAEVTDYLDSLLGTGPSGETLAGLDAVADTYLRGFLSAKAAHARERGAELVLGEATWVEGQLAAPVDVTTVLGNLVDNAVDAAVDGSRRPALVEVELMTDGAALLVTVADTGDGIPPERAEAVFHEGVSTKQQDGTPGGRGLGLALSCQIARSRDGEVRLAELGGPPPLPPRQPEPPGPSPLRGGTPVPGVTAHSPVSGGAVFVARLPRAMEAPHDPLP